MTHIESIMDQSLLLVKYNELHLTNTMIDESCRHHELQQDAGGILIPKGSYDHSMKTSDGAIEMAQY